MGTPGLAGLDDICSSVLDSSLQYRIRNSTPPQHLLPLSYGLRQYSMEYQYSYRYRIPYQARAIESAEMALNSSTSVFSMMLHRNESCVLRRAGDDALRGCYAKAMMTQWRPALLGAEGLAATRRTDSFACLRR